MSGAAFKYTDEQRHAAKRIAEVIRAVARVMPELDLMMAMADHEVRDEPGYGSTLDALAELEFPEWCAGTATKPGMGRRQWSAIRIPDPNSANYLAYPKGGAL